MKKEYSFEGAKQGKFYRPRKVPKTIRFDPDILAFYRQLAEQERIPYQTLINMTLRKFAVEGGMLTISSKGATQQLRKKRRRA